ncbi:hypothetical protein ACP275_08G004700 [Erythranthe tilingii]
MASWNSVNLKVIYNVLGWIAFVCWSISFHPQVVLNFKRKSNWLIWSTMLPFCLALLCRTNITTNMILIRCYLLLQMIWLSPYMLFYCLRGSQKFLKTSICLVSIAMLAAAICVLIAIPKHSWFWLVSCFNTIQVIMTVTMYFPQALLNFKRKTTSGFSVGNILLDFLGGITNAIQMVMQSIDQNSLENLFGNIGKTLLALVTIFFDIVLLIQHYLLYPSKKIPPPPPNSTVVNVELTKEINQC